MSKNELVIYRSSAGSGKTYTLVFEYLKLVIQKPSLYRSILAITFTNKATEEMKSRIVDALVAISENKETELQESLSTQSGIPLQQITIRAAKVLDYILHDYSGFAVSTIDSFFSKMVRSLARELHLPLRFDIELDTGSVIREITNMLFDDIAKDKWLRQWLENFIFDKLQDEKGWRIEPEIHKIAKQLFDEKYRALFSEGSGKPENELIADLKKLISDFEKKMISFGDIFYKIAAENELSMEDFFQGKNGPAGYFNKIRKPLKSDGYIPGVRFLNAVESEDAWCTKKSQNADLIRQLAGSKLIPLAAQTKNYIDQEYPRYIGAGAVLSTAYVAGIIGMLDEKLKIFRDENEMVLLSDTNLILSKAISGQDAPFIYEKSGNRFSHFMLDEFQDTSDFQWQNLFPLIQNAIGSGNYTLIVGDAKQSIYRWRGGNMQLLLNGIREQLKSFESITSNRRLEANYRSREVIINFNNRFFSLAPGVINISVTEGSPGSAYNTKDLEQIWKKGKSGDGYVKIKFFETGEESVDQSTGEIIESSAWKETACKESLATLHSLFEAGYELGDIAFLTRANSEAKEITTFLLQNGIERIISPESLHLNHSPKILFLVNLLTFINDPADNLALAHITYYWQVFCNPKENIILDDVFSESRKIKLQFLPEEFRKRLNEFRKIPLYETVEELTNIFNLKKEPEGFMQRFLDVILEYSGKNPANINDFLEWWEDNQDKDNCSVIVPSGENAIRVMSIHKSKGLQFPVVIIPFADWKLGPKSESIIWVKNNESPFNASPAHPVNVTKKLEHSIFTEDYKNEVLLNYIDNLNMLYVATTRAEEQLYIFSQIPKKPEDVNVKNAGELIFHTLQLDEKWKACIRHDETINFEQGMFSSPFRKKNTGTRTGINLTKWISIPWKDRLQLLISKKKISFYDPEPPETLYGTLFHAIVSEISTKINPETIVEKFIKSGLADVNLRDRLIKEIHYFIETAEANGWLDESAEILNETELLLEDGSVLRPDRMILKGDNAIIIDYKTGAEEKYHAKQVEQYATVLLQMGYSQTKMILIYPGLEKFVEVKAA